MVTPMVQLKHQGSLDVIRDNQEGRYHQTWAREQVRGVERAVALFVASLWPGVGERHVQARERERRQREEEGARQQREQEERERLRSEEQHAREQAEEETRRDSEAAEEAVGLRSPRPPGQEEGLRERRQAVVNDDHAEPAGGVTVGSEGKGKQPVRDMGQTDDKTGMDGAEGTNSEYN
jgi:hypothetical protein